MNYTADELIKICYQYYPKGVSDDNPGYKDTEESRRLVATRRREGEPDSTWHRFIREHLIPRFPGKSVQNLSLHLPVGHLDACGSVRIYSGKLTPEVFHNYLELHVSFIAPYYLLFACRTSPITQRLEGKLTLLPSEEPYARAIVEEVGATFPGYEFLSPDVGCVVVPDIVANLQRWGEVTLYHALFTDNLSLLSIP